MAKIFGIVNLHDGPHLDKLTEKRPLGATTFLGRYGVMDFALSNFSNSGIDDVGILIERQTHSIRNHVGNGQIWINNTKTGGQKLFFNENGISSTKFNTDINNLLANRFVLDEVTADYIIVAPVFFLMACDFRPIIDNHIASGKEISVVYKPVDNADKEFLNCDALTLKENKITKVTTNVGDKSSANISLETFVFNRKTFEHMLDTCRKVSAMFSIRKMVEYYITEKIYSVNGISFDGYVVPILSFNDYVNKSFDLLSYQNRLKLFKEDWPIYTTTHNTPPCLYSAKAKVSNSFVANGSIIKGEVNNSILSRDVIVEEGAVVNNCILFTGTKVGKGVVLENVVTDKKVNIKRMSEIKGEKNNYVYISQGASI